MRKNLLPLLLLSLGLLPSCLTSTGDVQPFGGKIVHRAIEGRLDRGGAVERPVHGG